jgi:hypothetical protein
MRKCSIALLNLTLIISFSVVVSAQEVSDERRQNTYSVLSDARIDVESKVNKTIEKPEIPLDFDNYFYKTKADKSNYWARTNNLDPQLKILTKSEYSSGAKTNSFKGQSNFKLPIFDFDSPGESEKSEIEDDSDNKNSIQTKEKFHWKAALIQSMIVLTIQHSFRMTEPKTTSQLKGRFFADWKKSVGNLRGWDDGNKFFTNYFAHPFQGAVTGRIFINNSDRAKKQEIGKSKTYWESRLKALAWSAVWSAQFELGPISEASLGNVGLKNNSGRSSLSWVDLVVTPVLGTGLVIGEDAIDKYILKNWLEKNSRYKLTTKIKILRTFLTPTTSFSNLLRGKPPWKRDNRPIYEAQTTGK